MSKAVPGFALAPNKTTKDYINEVWRVEDGLPHNSVRCVLQSNVGYMWVGTVEGLARFDGVKFTIFNKSNTKEIKNNNIRALYEDSRGNIWIGTSGGLNRLRDGKFFSYTTRDGLSHDEVLSICGDKNGHTWIGTERGLNCLKDGIFTIYTSKDGLLSNRVFALVMDKKDTLWIGSSGGLNRLQDGKITGYTEKDGLSGSVVTSIYEDKAGSLWIATFYGLDRLRNGKFSHYPIQDGLSNNYVGDIYEDKAGSLWIATLSGGYRLKNGRFTTFTDKDSPLNNIAFSSFTEDKEGSLWVGTIDGLSRLKDRVFTIINTKFGLSGDVIYSIMEDSGGSYWICTGDDGLNRWKDGKITVYTTKDGLSIDSLSIAFKDREGALWIGTLGGGLNRFKDGKFKVYTTANGLSQNTVFAILEDSEGSLWIGTYGGGLNRLKDGKFEVFTTKNGLSNNIVRSIYEDSKGTLWIGTSGGGLNRFKDGTFTAYTKKDGLSSNRIRPIYEDKDGVLWIGTYGGGLIRFKDGRFTTYTTDVGLFSDIVHQILEDDRGNLWMSCNNGIFRVKKAELNDFAEARISSVTCVSYGTLDGLESSECNGISQPPGFKGRDGRLWFPTMNGVAVINPSSIKVNTLPPPVIIEKFLVDDNALDLGNWDHRLSPGKKKFEFHFTALSFLVPQRVKLKYRLEGFEKKWNETGKHRTAQYTNISPGYYTFKVIACNNDGIWNEKGASIHFYLQPFFYQTWWFIVAAGFLVFLIILGFYKIRVRQLQKKKLELEKLVDKRTTQLKDSNIRLEKERQIAQRANQSKSEFLARMSHDIRTPMNAIVGFTDLLLDTPLNDQQLEFASTVNRSVEALIALLNDILDFSKIEAGELTFDPIDFDPEVTAFDICELVSPRIGTKNVELLCRIGADVPTFIKCDPGRFRQVIFNLMGNATKFTEKGEIELSLDVEKKEDTRIKMHVKVRDTGIGIPSDKIDKIFEAFQQADSSTTREYGGTGLGLSICKQIAQLMGGDVWVESKKGIGSIFHFTCWAEKSKKKPARNMIYDSLKGKRALIIDDNSTNLEILAHLLEQSNMLVVKVLNPKELIPIIVRYFKNQNNIDICIIDIQMPELDGFGLAREIRKLKPPMSELKLLALSSASLSHAKIFKDAGFNGFLPKPVRRSKLLKMLLRLLSSAMVTDEDNPEEMLTQHTIIEESKHLIHILLVEDNLINLRLALFLLEKAGYHVTVAKDGKEAVDLFTAEPGKFDLILMDIQMPGLDGREATKRIRKKGFKDIPIIAMTAEAMKGDREKCIEAGMNDYIGKPIKRDEVFKMIKKWCLDR